MEHKAGAMLSEQSLSIFSGILSGPHALLGFMLLKSLATPFVDTDISGISHVVFVGRVGNSSVFSSVKMLGYHCLFVNISLYVIVFGYRLCIDLFISRIALIEDISPH